MSSSTTAARPTNAHLATWLYRFCWLLLLLLPLFLSLPHLNDFAWNYDEGPLLQTAALANKGFPLYTEAVFNKPPLLIWWLQLAFVVGGTAVATARLSMLLLNLVGLAALGWLAAHWWQQRWAGPLAIALFLLMPDALVRLSVVMNDLPGMTLLLLTFGALSRFQQTKQAKWTAVSGFLFGLTLGIHPLLLFAAVPLAFLLLRSQPIGKPFVKSALLFGGMTLLATAVWLLPSYSAEFVHWVISYNSAELGSDLQVWAASNTATLLHFLLHDHWLLLLLTLLFLPKLVTGPQKIFGQTAVLWLLNTVFALLQLNPMWPHYRIFVIYPLVLLAAGGAAKLGEQVVAAVKSGGKRPFSQPLYLGASLGVALLLTVQYMRQPHEWPVWQADSAAARLYLAEQSRFSQMIIGDDQFLLFTAGQLTPPPLAETSSKRISTGFLTVPEIINSRFAYEVTQFVFTDGRFNQLPELQKWVESQPGTQMSFGNIAIYQLSALPEAPTAVDSSLGSGIHLNDYATSTTNNGLEIWLYWETAVAQTEDFHRFVHLLDETGTLVSQVDGIPLAGWLPTHSWQPGVQIVENVTLSLPEDLPTGKYTLVTGMYTFPQIQRLTATNSNGTRWPNDAILLQEIVIP